MSETESVLLLDDGELDDIRSLLEQMEVPFTHLRGEQIRDGLEPPRDLLISTPRRALAVQGLPGSESGPGLTTRIGVVDGNSATLRSMLRRNGFDFLLRRPFHPEIVRLLIIRTLFQGDEKRKEQRVPVGHEVSFKTGLWPRKATLADLSIRGCRLLCNRSVEARTRVTVVLPVAVTGSRSLTVPGRVLRSVPEPEDGRPEFFCIGVAFDPMSRGLKRRLTAVVAQRAQGAPALPDRPPSSLWDVAARRLSAAVPWGSSARNNEDTAPLARQAEPRTQPPAPRPRPADSPDEEPCLELDTLAAPLSDSADELNPFETVDLSHDAPV